MNVVTSRSILVVEPDPGVGRMLLLVLRSAGFAAVHTGTGADALKVLAEGWADAAVIDPDLPDGLGGRVMDRLRMSEKSGTDVPWVVVSAQDEEDLRGAFGSLGDYFLSKPFDIWNLVRILQTLVD